MECRLASPARAEALEGMGWITAKPRRFRPGASKPRGGSSYVPRDGRSWERVADAQFPGMGRATYAGRRRASKGTATKENLAAGSGGRETERDHPSCSHRLGSVHGTKRRFRAGARGCGRRPGVCTESGEALGARISSYATSATRAVPRGTTSGRRRSSKRPCPRPREV